MTLVYIALGFLFCLYGLFVFAAGSGTKFFMVWIALGALMFLVAGLFGHGRWKKYPVGFRRGLLIALLLCFLVFAATQALILRGFRSKGSPGLDAVIVLGAQVYRDGPSAVLKYRLDEAKNYLEENKNTVCIVTGGKGYNEPFPEAYGMRDYLVRNGIAEERIVMEDESSSTLENIMNSLPYIDPEHDEVGIITNDFHVFRGTAIAKKAGIKKAVGIAAGSNPLYLPNNLLREFLGVVKDTLKGNM